nr:microtubule-associated serine/threonine-protein kinase 2-like [Odocoileus virginianus texanus]
MKESMNRPRQPQARRGTAPFRSPPPPSHTTRWGQGRVSRDRSLARARETARGRRWRAGSRCARARGKVAELSQSQPLPLPSRRRAPPGRQRLEERTGPAGPEVREQDVITGRSPLLFRKLSNPDIFSSTGKAKLQRQLSQDDCKLRRGSLASSLSGKQLLPLSGSAHSSVGQVSWQSSGEASNLVWMRNQSLGQSAPSLTAGLILKILIRITYRW